MKRCIENLQVGDVFYYSHHGLLKEEPCEIAARLPTDDDSRSVGYRFSWWHTSVSYSINVFDAPAYKIVKIVKALR